MSVQSILMDYRELLQQQVEIKKQELDLSVAIRVCEKRLEIEASRNPVSHSSRSEQAFTEKYGEQLEPEDFVFLEQMYRGGTEVESHTKISQTHLKRLADAGKIDVKKRSKGEPRKYNTQSVIGYLVNAKTEEEA